MICQNQGGQFQRLFLSDQWCNTGLDEFEAAHES